VVSPSRGAMHDTVRKTLERILESDAEDAVAEQQLSDWLRKQRRGVRLYSSRGGLSVLRLVTKYTAGEREAIVQGAAPLCLQDRSAFSSTSVDND
jgi:hypothetical protein